MSPPSPSLSHRFRRLLRRTRLWVEDRALPFVRDAGRRMLSVKSYRAYQQALDYHYDTEFARFAMAFMHTGTTTYTYEAYRVHVTDMRSFLRHVKQHNAASLNRKEENLSLLTRLLSLAFTTLNLSYSSTSSSSASIYKKEIARHLRLQRSLSVSLVRTAEDLYPLSDLVRTFQRTSDLYLKDKLEDVIDTYADIMNQALITGLPQLWVPLHSVLKHHGILRPSKDCVPVPGYIQDVTSEDIALSLYGCTSFPLSAQHRHLRLLAHHFPVQMKELCRTSTERSPEGAMVRHGVLQALSSAHSPETYTQWYTLCTHMGFMLKEEELWRISRSLHRVPSPYACAVHCLPQAFHTASFPLPLDRSGPEETSLRTLLVAGYALPLLFEGPSFLQKAHLAWTDIVPLAPSLRTLSEEAPLPPLPPGLLEGVWHPWQHLVACLVLEEVPHATGLASVLSSRLRAFEGAWGPPCTLEGGIASFQKWYGALLTLKERYAPYCFEDTPSTQEALEVWHRTYEQYVLRATLAPSSQEESSSSLPDTLSPSSSSEPPQRSRRRI